MSKKQQQQSDSANGITLSYREILDMNVAVQQMEGANGYTNVFGLDTVLRRTHNMRVLKQLAEEYTETQNALVKQYSTSDAPNEVSQENIPNFNADIKALLDKELPVNLRRFDFKQLNIRKEATDKEGNIVTSAVISALFPILDNIELE